jgi:uncharacterized protein YdhG (YjbR/CyaY superfamily)
MTRRVFKSVDEYLAAQPESLRAILERVRIAVRKAVPGVEEVISYRIPTYKLGGRPVIYFAGWKEHFSLYPATGGVAEAFQEELAPYELSKGTIRFPLSRPVPIKLIERIAKFRAKELGARVGAKTAKPKKRPRGGREAR